MPRRKKADDLEVSANVDLSPIEDNTQTAETESEAKEKKPRKKVSKVTDEAAVTAESESTESATSSESEDPTSREEGANIDEATDTNMEDGIALSPAVNSDMQEAIPDEVTSEEHQNDDSDKDVGVTPVNILEESEEPPETVTAEDILDNIDDYSDLDNHEDTASEHSNDVFPELFEEDAESMITEIEEDSPNQKNKSTAELAQELRSLEQRRRGQATDADASNEQHVHERQPQRNNEPKRANKFYGFTGGTLPKDTYNDALMWNELRMHIPSGIPILCKVVSSLMHNRKVCAVCEPLTKKFSTAPIFVPFEELDIPSRRVLSQKNQQLFIERRRINTVERVCITAVDENAGYADGSIRLGNMRTRKDAYFRGVKGPISTSNQTRKIIEKGTIARAYIVNVLKDGILVNIFGTVSMILKSELSYEYIDHPRKDFKPGESILVKILDVKKDENRDYYVRVKASVKALKENETIIALNKYAKVGRTYLGKVSVLSPNKLPVVFCSLGFNCIIGAVLTDEPYTVGSLVGVKLRSRTNNYAFGDIVRVYEYTPQRYT